MWIWEIQAAVQVCLSLSGSQLSPPDLHWDKVKVSCNNTQKSLHYEGEDASLKVPLNADLTLILCTPFSLNHGGIPITTDVEEMSEYNRVLAV